jgi:hypothetical protein
MDGDGLHSSQLCNLLIVGGWKKERNEGIVVGMQWRACTEAKKQKHKATCLRRRPHNEQNALDLDNTSKQGPLSDPYYFGTPSSRSLLSFWDLLLDSPVGRVQEIAPTGYQCGS